MFRIRAAYVWILYEVEGFLLAQVAVGVNGPMLWSQRVMGKKMQSFQPVAFLWWHSHATNSPDSMFTIKAPISSKFLTSCLVEMFSEGQKVKANLSNRASHSSGNQTEVLFLPHCIQN